MSGVTMALNCFNCIGVCVYERGRHRKNLLAEQFAVNSNWTTKSMCECENSFGDAAKVSLPLLEENGNKDKRE